MKTLPAFLIIALAVLNTACSGGGTTHSAGTNVLPAVGRMSAFVGEQVVIFDKAVPLEDCDNYFPGVITGDVTYRWVTVGSTTNTTAHGILKFRSNDGAYTAQQVITLHLSETIGANGLISASSQESTSTINIFKYGRYDTTAHLTYRIDVSSTGIISMKSIQIWTC